MRHYSRVIRTKEKKEYVVSKTYKIDSGLIAAGERADLEIMQDQLTGKYAVRSALWHLDGRAEDRYWPDNCEFRYTADEVRGICEVAITGK